MKEKIKEALRQEYKTRLELHDDQLNGVAAFAATFVTEEGKIEEFVKNPATFNMLKSYQSMLDKDREKRKSGSEQGQQGSETGEKTKNSGEVDPTSLSKMISDAVALANKPILDELNAMKAEKAVGDTISTVDKRIESWGYGKGFPKEMAKARKHAMKLFEANGRKWSADELEAAIKEEFNDEVSDRGLDTTKPYQGEGGGDSEKRDSNNAFAEDIRNALGIEKK